MRKRKVCSGGEITVVAVGGVEGTHGGGLRATRGRCSLARRARQRGQVSAASTCILTIFLLLNSFLRTSEKRPARFSAAKHPCVMVPSLADRVPAS